MRETVVLRIVEKLEELKCELSTKNVKYSELKQGHLASAISEWSLRGGEGVYSTQILDTTKPHNFRKNKKSRLRPTELLARG